jgi:hypothetical protein
MYPSGAACKLRVAFAMAALVGILASSGVHAAETRPTKPVRLDVRVLSRDLDAIEAARRDPAASARVVAGPQITGQHGDWLVSEEAPLLTQSDLRWARALNRKGSAANLADQPEVEVQLDEPAIERLRQRAPELAGKPLGFFIDGRLMQVSEIRAVQADGRLVIASSRMPVAPELIARGLVPGAPPEPIAPEASAIESLRAATVSRVADWWLTVSGTTAARPMLVLALVLGFATAGALGAALLVALVHAKRRAASGDSGRLGGRGASIACWGAAAGAVVGIYLLERLVTGITSIVGGASWSAIAGAVSGAIAYLALPRRTRDPT